MSKFVWNPIHDMREAEQIYGEELGLNNDWAKWGIGQLLYFKKLNLSEINEYIDFDRMNWDGTYAQDFATLASIMRTNLVPCLSWEIFCRLFDVYQRNWKSRFLISLCCQALGTPGYIGAPLYYSEFFGDYPPSFIKQKKEAKDYIKSDFDAFKSDFRSGRSPFELLRRPRFADPRRSFFEQLKRQRFADPIIFHKEIDILKTIEQSPSDALRELIEAMITKLSHEKTREDLLEMMETDKWHLVYPFLLEGSFAYASYRKLEKRGGMKKVISDSVPANIQDELYNMLIATSARLFYSWPTNKFKFDDIFKRIHIKEVLYFGGDTSIRTSPLFTVLQGELGHFYSDAIRIKISPIKKHTFISEWASTMFQYSPKVEKLEPELSFDQITDSSPPEMVALIRAERSSPMVTPKLTFKPAYFKRLREEDIE